jgi:hypothetical protein
MSIRSVSVAVTLGVAVAMAIATTTLADTCCGTASVTFDPPAADPGELVRVDGLRCVEADGAGPLPLDLGGFWLTTLDREAFLESSESASTDAWPAFTEVPASDAEVGAAVIRIPDLPPGSYTLWWECLEAAGTGTSSAVRHVSTGLALQVGPAAPDTATALPPDSRSADGSAAVTLAAVGVAGGLVVAMVLPRRRYAAE